MKVNGRSVFIHPETGSGYRVERRILRALRGLGLFTDALMARTDWENNVTLRLTPADWDVVLNKMEQPETGSNG